MTEQTPPDSKLTTTKGRWAALGQFLTGRVTRPETDRLPPGQHVVKDWPVLDLGVHPKIDPAQWSLRVFGAVKEAVTWDWATFRAQQQLREVTDIHCVTTWSRYDNEWEGVSTRTVLDAFTRWTRRPSWCCTATMATPPTYPWPISPLRTRSWRIPGTASP